jgi:hypothetical protein
MFVDHLTDCERDLCSATQRIALAGHGSLDADEVALGGSEELLALAGALSGEIRVTADHEALTGEFGCGDARHVALIEQRELQGASFHQPLDRRCAQRGDPVQAGRLDVRGDPRLGDHAAVAEQDDMVQVEALLKPSFRPLLW